MLGAKAWTTRVGDAEAGLARHRASPLVTAGRCLTCLGVSRQNAQKWCCEDPRAPGPASEA